MREIVFLRSIKVILLISFTFLYIAGNCAMPFPGNLKFRSISKEQGLSSSTVYCIFQDSKGFLWIGTKNGLNLYDGYKVSKYYYSASDKNTISSNDITAITEDKDGIIWIGTGVGLNRFDRTHRRFQRIQNEQKDIYNIGSNLITSLLCDTKGNLLVGTLTRGLRILPRGEKKFKHMLFVKNKKPNPLLEQITCLYAGSQGRIWIGTRYGGLTCLKDGTYVTYRANEGGYINSDGISALSEDKQGNIWVGTKNAGLSVFAINGPIRQRFKKSAVGSLGLKSNVIKSIISDSGGNVWIGTENGGLHVYDPSSGSIVPYRSSALDQSGFSQRTASYLLEDAQHNLYVGSHSGGVFIYSPDRYKFNLLVDRPSNGPLSYKDVKTFTQDTEGKIWIGTDGGGINVWDRKNNTFRNYRYRTGDPRSLGSDAVLTLYTDRKGTIWAGTWGGGLSRFNPKTNDFTRFVHTAGDPGSISSNNISQIFEDSDGQLWVGTFEAGINVYQPANSNFLPFTGNSSEENKIIRKSILSIHQDSNKTLWFATDESILYSFNKKTKKLRTFFYPNSQRNRSFYGNVEVIFTDSRGRLWIGKNGLMVFNEKTGRFEDAVLGYRFKNSTVFGILEDERGNFWISSTDGLIKYHPDHGYYKKFTEADGLQGLEFSRNAYYKAKNGEMFFGGKKGANNFFPAQVNIGRFPAPLYFTALEVFNREITTFDKESPIKMDIGNAKEISLQYNQSVFTLEYAALNFGTPEETQYKYKLTGFDKHWSEVGKLRRATYTNLDPGSYLFEVKATMANGEWNPRSTVIRINIIPPFWMTWWFKTLLSLTVLSAFFIILYLKRKSELSILEKKKKEEIQLSQLQFFTNISHELRTPLSLILGPLENVMKNDDRPLFGTAYRTMHRNAIRLMKLISEIIDFRKVETGHFKLRVTKGDINAIIEEILFDFADKAKELQIDLSYRSVKYENTWFDRQVVEKILINILQNSLKYTPEGGRIQIEIFSSLSEFSRVYKNELVLKSGFSSKMTTYICITDNGQGISESSLEHLFDRYFRVPQTHLGSGLGLAFVKSLVFLHKGSIKVYSENMKGTQILIAIPTGKDDYPESVPMEHQPDIPWVSLESVEYKSDFLPSVVSLSEKSREGNHDKQKRNILLIEDNIELRAFLRESLEPLYFIAEADNGKLGLEAAKQILPDLIISDVMMPIMDGIELCSHIKEDIETSHIPVILLTAKDTIDDRISGVEHGADHYFSKPVNMELLILTIQNLFEQREKLKERYLKDYTIAAKELAYSAKDREFIDKVLRLVGEEIENPDFNVEELCRHIGMSQTALLRKMKEITGQTINEFVRSVRMKTALHILTHEDVTITEVMYRVGILSPSYFTTVFKKEFGKTPSQFLSELRKPEK